MTNPTAVKEFIGCYCISVEIVGQPTVFINRASDKLTCTATRIQDATVFALYREKTQDKDAYDTQVQSMADGKWLLDCKGCIPIILVDAKLGSPDEPAVFILESGGWKAGTLQDGTFIMLWPKSTGENCGLMTLPDDHNAPARFLGFGVPVLIVEVLGFKVHEIIAPPAELKQKKYDGVNFGYIFMDNADFDGSVIVNCNFRNVTFRGRTSFANAVLDGNNFSGHALDGANFSGASLKNVNFSGASLKGCDFTGATLDNINFANADLTGANLKGRDFTGAVLDNANLERADLTGANLSQARLPAEGQPMRIGRSASNATNFTSARVNKELLRSTIDHNDVYDWSYAILNGASFVKTDPSNPGLTIPDRDLNNLIAKYADLTGVQFSGENPAQLRHADLSYSSLGGANLVNAMMDHADLTGATLSTPDGLQRCNLTEGHLLNVKFTNADMSYAQMPYCYLYGDQASLAGATLRQADFTGAYLVAADFSSLKDSAAQGINFNGACLVNANFAGTNFSTAGTERATSFVKACLQGANFHGVSARGTNFVDAAVSEDKGALKVIGGIMDGRTINFEVTTTPQDTEYATCPNDQRGPCSGAMWQSSNAPMTEWHYNATKS